MISITIFAMVTCFFFTYITVYTTLDLPYSFTIESCTNRYDPETRPITAFNVFVFQIPNLFSICSLLVDLFLVKFLRKTIMPQFSNPQPVEILSTISNRLDQGKAGYTIVLRVLHHLSTVFQRIYWLGEHMSSIVLGFLMKVSMLYHWDVKSFCV